MSSLPHRLGFEAGARVLLISAPETVRDLLAGVDHGARVAARGTGPFDVVLAFAARQREVARLFKQAHAVLLPEGKLWIAYPQTSSGAATDLDRRSGWGALGERGWAAAEAVPLDAKWMALHFRHDPVLKARHVARRLKRAEEKPTAKIKKGGDSKVTVKLRRDQIGQPNGTASSETARTKATTEPAKAAVVRTPDDLREALAHDEQAKTRWGRLSPARKREVLAVIDEVRTPSARARRIAKVVEELGEG